MNESQLRLTYNKRHAYLCAYGNWVLEQVMQALRPKLTHLNDPSKFFQISPIPRVKDVDSFIQKALTRKLKSDPLNEIEDQVGLRFVVLLVDDVEAVGGVVARNALWKATRCRDFHAERRLRPYHFDYQSDHFVVRNRSELEIDELVIPVDTPCEIQIRTILQHAYAEMAHGSSYKPPARLLEEDQNRVDRSLARGAALIETTDEVFSSIRRTISTFQSHIRSLLLCSRDVYADVTSHGDTVITKFAEGLADEYRSLLSKITVDDLKSWTKVNRGLLTAIVLRFEESFIWRDPVVVLLSMLVVQFPSLTLCHWPEWIEVEPLESVYIAMGVSTEGVS